MAQLDYYKLVRKFPEIIDTDDSVEFKSILIEYVKKQYHRKQGKHALLPINISKLSKINLEKYSYKIKYKNDVLLIIRKNSQNQWIINESHSSLLYHSYFLTKEEIQGVKRTILIDNIFN